MSVTSIEDLWSIRAGSPPRVTTRKTSVSRARDAGGGGVTAAATLAIASIRHVGRTTDLADSFGAGSSGEFYGARECMK